MVQNGPERIHERSSTRTPASGPVVGGGPGIASPSRAAALDAALAIMPGGGGEGLGKRRSYILHPLLKAASA